MSGRESDVSTEQKREALDLWFATYGEFSIARFTAQLGYPNSGTMSRWIGPIAPATTGPVPPSRCVPKLGRWARRDSGEKHPAAARAVGLSAVASPLTCARRAPPPPPKGDSEEGPQAWRRRPPRARRPGGPPQVPAELPDDPDELKAIMGGLGFDNAVLRRCWPSKSRPGVPPEASREMRKAKAALALQPAAGGGRRDARRSAWRIRPSTA